MESITENTMQDALVLVPVTPSPKKHPRTRFKGPAGNTTELVRGRPRKKAKAPKVRTGCFTCRARRVKCDETKPGCSRCKTFGVECGGYPSMPTYTFPGKRQLVPRQHPAAPAVSIQSLHVGPRFSDQEACRYFYYYCSEIAFQLSGPFQTQLWHRLVPQVGDPEPFVWHAIVALGALSKAHSGDCHRLTTTQNPHLRYALVHYGKALKGMRDSIQKTPLDHRSVVVSCLLVFCFESLQGHQTTAAAHASSVVTLLRQDFSNQSDVSRCNSTSWKRPPLGEDLYVAISSLDIQSLLFHDTRPRVAHQNFKEDIGLGLQGMPEEISDLQACRRYWQYIMRRNLHFVAAARAEGQDPAAWKQQFYTPFDDVEAFTVEDTDPSILRSILSERDRYIKDISRWECASAKLFSRTQEEGKTSPDFVMVCLLKIYAAVNVVFLSRTCHPLGTTDDELLPHFQAVVELSTQIRPLLFSSPTEAQPKCTGTISETENNAGEANVNSLLFRFDIGIIPALSQVGLLCRHRETRRKAVELLLSGKGYREGIWDSEAMGRVGEWIRTVEEDVLKYPSSDALGDDGYEKYVKFERRVKILGVDIRLEERQAGVRFKRNCEATVVREKVVSW